MTRVSVGIQHHPARPQALARLQEQLPDADVVSDPAPDGETSSYRSYRHALEQTPSWATHRAVIQDDAVVCVDFMAGLPRAIAAYPHRLICLCVTQHAGINAEAVRIASHRGKAWTDMSPLVPWIPAIALVWPAWMADDFAHWTPPPLPIALPRESDATIIASYCQHRDIVPLATVPSMVEHPDDMPSLLAGELGSGRQAEVYTGASAVFANWRTPTQQITSDTGDPRLEFDPPPTSVAGMPPEIAYQLQPYGPDD
jgi:hypothetical protein